MTHASRPAATRTAPMRWIATIGMVCALALVASCTSDPAPTAKHLTSTRAVRTPSPSASSSTSTSTPPTAPPVNPTASAPTPPAPTSTEPSAAGPPDGPVPAGFVPMSATFDSPDHGWVLGDAPCGTPPCTSILRTRDGGHSWHGIPAPRTAIASSDTARHAGVGQPKAGQVSSIRFGDESNGWAFGTGLWSTHDGGASWKQQSIAQAVDRTVALESSSGSAYAVVATGCAPDPGNGCNSVVLYQTPVGSDHWQQVGPPQPADAPGSREGEYAQLVLRGDSYFVLAGSAVFGRTSDQAFGPLSQPCTDPGFPYAEPTALAAADSKHLDVMCSKGDAHMGRETQQLLGSTDGGNTSPRRGPTSKPQAPT